MKKYLLLAALALVMACSLGIPEGDFESSSHSKPPEIQQNETGIPRCECNGSACFCLEPGAIIVYWERPEGVSID